MGRYCIYCYTNDINGKKYVGQTCNSLKKRAGSGGCHYVIKNGAFGNAIQKYGWYHFTPEILEEGLTLEEANEREKHWIKELNTLAPNGYNLDEGGLNKSTHESTRKKLSENNARYWKGKKLPPEAIEKNRQARLGKKQSAETIRKRSEALRGRHIEFSNEWKEKQIEAHKRRCRPVQQFTKDMILVAEYPSVKDAIEQTGIRHIDDVCLGKPHCNTVGGYYWKFKDDTSFTPRENMCKKKVAQYTKDGQIIAEYDSIVDAAKALGKDGVGHISDCCKGNRKYCWGFQWRYIEGQAA